MKINIITIKAVERLIKHQERKMMTVINKLAERVWELEEKERTIKFE